MKIQNYVKITALLTAMVIFSGTISGCMSNHHIVGNGAQTGIVNKSRQWYALWGLVKLGGEPNTKAMSGDSANYEITTYYGVTDWFVNFFLGTFTISSRSVKVTK